MYKTLALAAVVGTAAAQITPIQLFTFDIKDSNNKVMYHGDAVLNANVGYTTLYNAPSANPNGPSPDNTESYSFNINAGGMLTYNHEAFQSYKSTYDFVLQVLNFTPYGQTVGWNRFDNGAAMGGRVTGYRDLQVGNFFTRVRENAKTCSWSVFNNGGSMNPVCAYNDDKQTDYMDPVWKFNLGQFINTQMNDQLDMVLGPHAYYDAMTQ